MKNIYEKVKKAFESKILVGILYGIGGVVVILFIFLAGVDVGQEKASFGSAWGEHYYENFGMMNRGIPGGMMGNLPNAHGAIGKIIKIELPTIIVQDIDNTEKVILTTDDTKIVNVGNNNSVADLKVDQSIVVIGSPNAQGQIEAKFIRIMPFPPVFPLNSSTPSSKINNPTQ
jgi:hypothetical protein